MTPAGVRAYEENKGRQGVYAYENAQKELSRGRDRSSSAPNKAAWADWEKRPAGYRRLVLHWIASAKKPETRARRLATLIEDSAAGPEDRRLRYRPEQELAPRQHQRQPARRPQRDHPRRPHLAPRHRRERPARAASGRARSAPRSPRSGRRRTAAGRRRTGDIGSGGAPPSPRAGSARDRRRRDRPRARGGGGSARARSRRCRRPRPPRRRAGRPPPPAGRSAAPAGRAACSPRGCGAARAAARAGRHPSSPAASAAAASARRLGLQLGLLGEEEQGPGDRIGGGLVAGEIEGRGIVDRERQRLLVLELVVERADQPAEEIVGPAARQPLARPPARASRADRPGRAARACPRRLHGISGRPSRACSRASLTPSSAAVIWSIAASVISRAIAGEQGVGDDPHRRRGRRRGHVARPGLRVRRRRPRGRRPAPARRSPPARNWRRRSCAGRATGRRPRRAGRGRWSRLSIFLTMSGLT